MTKTTIIIIIVGLVFAAICAPVLFRVNKRVSEREKELIRSEERFKSLGEKYKELVNERKKQTHSLDSIKNLLKSHQKVTIKKEIVYEKELSSILSLSADSTFKLLHANIKRADTLR